MNISECACCQSTDVPGHQRDVRTFRPNDGRIESLDICDLCWAVGLPIKLVEFRGWDVSNADLLRAIMGVGNYIVSNLTKDKDDPELDINGEDWE